jgi:hypothetical protein
MQKLLCIFHRPTGSQRCLLNCVAQLHSETAAISEMTLDAVGEIANGKYYLVDMMSLKVFDHMLQKRSVHNRDHGLREVTGKRT